MKGTRYLSTFEGERNMSNPYIARVEKMVSSRDISMTWSTLEQAKRYVANIRNCSAPLPPLGQKPQKG